MQIGIGLGLTSRRASGSAPAFSPASLFAASEPGVWLDPSDLTTMFQDTAGTIPVTTPGQPVALVLDKSKGLVLGSELVTNGTFDTDTSWTKVQVTTTILGGALNLVSPNLAGDVATQAISGLTSGLSYKLVFSVIGRSAGSFKFIVRNGANTVTVAEITSGVDGTYTLVFVATGTSHFLRLQAVNTNTVLSIDNISVKELPGFHATQATTASRPTYGIVPLGGRRNLLTFTEQFDNAAWGKTAGSVSATADPQQWYFANDGISSTSILAAAINPSGDAVFAIDIKADTIRYVRLRYGNVTNTSLVNIDAQTGTTDGTAGVNVGDGFYRFVLPFVSGADNNGILNITLSDTSGGTTVTPSASKRIVVRRPQFELGSTATAYQRVSTAFDVTEAGVQSVSYLFDDLVDDQINWTASAGTNYTVAWVDNAGSVTIQTAQSLSGTTDALRVQRMAGYLAINRALTAEETINLTNWFRSKVGL